MPTIAELLANVGQGRYLSASVVVDYDSRAEPAPLRFLPVAAHGPVAKRFQCVNLIGSGVHVEALNDRPVCGLPHVVDLYPNFAKGTSSAAALAYGILADDHAADEGFAVVTAGNSLGRGPSIAY